MRNLFFVLVIIAATSFPTLGDLIEVDLEVDPVISHFYSEGEHHIRDSLYIGLPNATLAAGDIFRANVTFTDGKFIKVIDAEYVAMEPVYSTAGGWNSGPLTNDGLIGLEITSYQNVLNTTRSAVPSCYKLLSTEDYYFVKAFFFDRGAGEIVDESLFGDFTVEFTVPTTVEGSLFSTKTYNSNYIRIEADLCGAFDDQSILVVVPHQPKTYYVDASEGSDNNDGLSPQTAFATIQKAINMALDGDTVLVADGTYTGPGNRDIDFLGKAITVRSENGPENCIIDCNYAGRGFNFDNGEDANSVLDGFTITNGAELSGGGIYCYHSSPTITNCIITGNHAGAYTGDGGGILCVMSSPVITNCTINRNSARGLGDGIFCYKGTPTIKNCTIRGNSGSSGIFCYYSNLTITNCTIAENEGRGIDVLHGNLTTDNCIISSNSGIGPGGGIYCSGSAVITNCTINENTAEWGGGICVSGSAVITNCTINENTAEWGAGICCYYGSTTINNCTITGNSAEGELAYGGGILCAGDEDGNDTFTFSNCTITGNSATWGGGICCGYSSTTIANCILWANEAPNGPELYLAEDSNALVNYTDVQGGQTDVYVEPGCVLNWGTGNIDFDPYFVEPGYWADANDPNIIVEPNDPNAIWIDGDYHLLRTSPCVDAASDANVYTDIEGNIRPFDFPGVDNNGELPEFDMGAYELVPVEAAMKFTPQALSCNSKGKWVKAHFVLPEGFSPEDVDVNESAIAEPMGAESESIRVFSNNEGPVRLEIYFDREAFCDSVTETGEVEITVIGSLTTDQYFYATDTIKIKPRR